MSLNQWKLLIQLKETISKLYNDKSLQNVLNKDIIQVFQNLPRNFRSELLKYVDQSMINKSISTSNKLKTHEESNNLVMTIPPNKDSVSKPEKVKDILKAPLPKWRSSKDIISKVINFILYIINLMIYDIYLFL